MNLVEIYENKIKELVEDLEEATTKNKKQEIKDDIEFFMQQLTEAKKQEIDEQNKLCMKTKNDILEKEKVLAPIKSLPLPGLDILSGISLKRKELRQRKELQKAELEHKEKMLDIAYKASNEGYSLDREIERQIR